jgi:hypothetical protein
VLLPFVLFLVLVIWALIDGEMYAKEAAIFGALWLALLLGTMFLPAFGIYLVVPMVLIDIYLLVKLVGNPTI